MAKSASQKVTDFFVSYQTVRFDNKQTLIQADAAPEAIYYLLRGTVGQCAIDNAGNELIVNVFKKGSFFPLKWAIDNKTSSFYFKALAGVTCAKAPQQDVIEFLRSEPDVMIDVLRRVYSGTEGLLKKNAALMGSDARSRILLDLVITFERFGTTASEGYLLIPTKEVDIAKHTGLARETVNRQISLLKKELDITVTRDGIQIDSIDTLKKALE